MTERVHAIVQGLVQGVGFRYFVSTRAVSLGLGGWVRNRPDGTVEFEVEGDSAALDSLLHAVKTGPRSAHVSELRLERSEISHPVKSFEVR